MLKVAISMRGDDAQTYTERRDALARDWADFMKYAIPEAIWMPMPNVSRQAVDFVKGWGVNALILSSGNDLGEDPLRDETEIRLIEYAVATRLPVFGVCRGLQAICQFFGGEVQRCDSAIHVGKHHSVKIAEWSPVASQFDRDLHVNSYHHYAVATDKMPHALRVFARTRDGWAEGVCHRDYPIVAIQWHPERGRPFREFDRDLLRKTFGFPAYIQHVTHS